MDAIMLEMNFPEFLEKKYLEWQIQEGRKTVIEFAAYLGVSQPILSMWMSGKRRPGVDNIRLLVEIFGDEVYDSLGLQRPNPYLQRITRAFEFITEEKQRQLAEEAETYETQNQERLVQHTQKQRKKKPD